MILLTLLIGSFFLLAILRVPLAFSLGLSSILVILFLDVSLATVMNNLYEGINQFTLLAVPLFLIAGSLMNEGKVTERLIQFSDSLVGHIRGGLGHVNVFVSMLFAGISGSAAADTAGIGSVLIPAMIKAGYDRPFTVAITACSSTMGIIIPPSIPMIIYGSFGNVSIGALFLGGIIPGILIGLSQMGITYYYARKRNYPAGEAPSLKKVIHAGKNATLPLGMPLLIVGGVMVGAFTATEASVIAVVYGLLLLLLFYKSMKLSDLPRIFSESAVFYALPMFMVANASVFGWLIAYLEGPERIVALIQSITASYYGVFFAIIILLLLLGTFLSPIVIIIIFLPIIQALGNLAGIHPVHLGVVAVMTLAIGLITPPYGICLLIAVAIAEISVLEAFRACFLLILFFIGIIILCVVFPDLVLFIPRTFMPRFF
jgi:tripartite ATP-independent transporter DctM subunit